MKKFVALILGIFLLFSLVACNSSDDTAKLQKRIAQLEQKNQELQNQIEMLQSGGIIIDNTNIGATDTNNTVETPIKLGETFCVGDVMEITLDSSEWCEEILPSNTSDFYSYYKDIDGEKFFVVKGKLKNLSGEAFDIQYASQAELLINDKYKASVVLETEETDGTSFYGEIKPLQTLNLIVYASISDDLYDSCKNVLLTMNIVNDESRLHYFYDDDTSHEVFTISFGK